MSARVVKSVQNEDGSIALVAPTVGFVRGLPDVGDVVVAGRPFAEIETLGKLETLVAPTGATGRVVRRLESVTARAPAGFGTELVALDLRTSASESSSANNASASKSAELVFRAPMSGRFYSRPAPTKPAMVEVGQVIELGEAVGLLEVMKTFNRVVYAGEGLPARARVVRIVPVDGDDVARGSVLLELESA